MPNLQWLVVMCWVQHRLLLHYYYNYFNSSMGLVKGWRGRITPVYYYVATLAR